MGKPLIVALALAAALGAGALLWLKREPPPLRAPAGAPLAGLLDKAVEGFASAERPWRFAFPADHGAHPAYRTETWHVTGSLSHPSGRRFAFQLAFFRIGVNPPAAQLGPSAWAARDVYRAHFALTDAAAGRFLAFEQLSRAALGFGGAEASPVRVWLGDWTLGAHGAAGEALELRAAQDQSSIALTLRNAKPPVTRTAGGFHSYLMTRLVAQGTVRVGAQSFDVEGRAWLDRAWGEVPLPVGAVVWDRFLLQLDDGRDLMVLRLRRRDGSGEPVLSGLMVERDGAARALSREDLAMEALGHWSAHDGTRYPTRWRLRLPREAIELELVAWLPDQQLPLSLRYWAGAVSATGSEGGKALRGSGHVESPGTRDASAAR